MCCRRCGYARPIKLEKRLEKDNDVFRCGECGYIFSPVSRGEEPAGAAEAPGRREQPPRHAR